MGETKKIVVEHYAVERLPEELRRGIESGQMVRVTVETEAVHTDAASAGKYTMRSFLGAAPGLYGSAEDVVEFFRKQRDESDR